MHTVNQPKPVLDDYFADPFVWEFNGEFLAVGTGEREAHGDPSELIFPVLRSPDLKNWQRCSRALLRPNPSLGTHFWAPEVAHHQDKFFLYYSVGFEDRNHQIRVATSDRPTGPFQDVGRALVDPANCPFAIDAHPYRDDDGKWYLFYARDFLDCDANVRAGTALMVAPMKSMVELDHEGRVILRASRDWQRFERGRCIHGGIYDWHTLEGPFVRKHGARYYCFYSGGCWETESYGVDYGIAESIMGPYSDGGNECGPRVLHTLRGELLGPGHNSIVRARDGAEWIVYHAWDPSMTARRMFIDRLNWTAAGPRCERWLSSPAPQIRP